MASKPSGLKLSSILLYGGLSYTAIFIVSKAIAILRKKQKAAYFAKVAKAKRAQRDQKIKELSQSLPSLDISPSLQEKILNSDATALLEMLKSQEITSEQILVTYFKRAITIGLELELITEITFEEALAKARECDRLRKENPSASEGILFGLPMTVKDNFILKGTDCSGGLASKLNNPAQDDGFICKLLKGEGAIPFAKTNLPQALLIHNTSNFIWGTAQNPWKYGRTCGGSSGGESGLVAARCSPFGIGTDIGGSIRIPALFCGVVGFKPTAERVMRAGTMYIAPALNNVLNMRSTAGPLTKSVRDVNLMMKALLNSDMHEKVKITEKDPYYLKKEWKEELVHQSRKGLRIGYFKSIDLFPASPANQRAIDEAVKVLKEQGYELIEVAFPNIEDLALIYMEIMGSEGNTRFLSDSLQGEKVIKDFDNLRVAASIPNSLRTPLKWLLTRLGEVRSGKVVGRVSKKSAYEYLELVERQSKARNVFLKVWENNKLDGLLSPGLPFPAYKQGFAKDTALGACYTFILNVLNLPTGVLPVTVVQKGEEVYPQELGKYHDFMYKRVVESMKDTEGLPVGVQISTLPWEEEKCVGIMLDLEEGLQFIKKHPFPK